MNKRGQMDHFNDDGGLDVSFVGPAKTACRQCHQGGTEVFSTVIQRMLGVGDYLRVEIVGLTHELLRHGFKEGLHRFHDMFPGTGGLGIRSAFRTRTRDFGFSSQHPLESSFLIGWSQTCYTCELVQFNPLLVLKPGVQCQKSLQLCAATGFELKTMENLSPEQRESLWRRKLSKAECEQLKNQPELELEAGLTDALAKISDVPVPSNFTARVLDAIDREEGRAARSNGWFWNWRLLLPRIAVAAVVLVFAGVSIEHYEVTQHNRTEMANSLRLVASASTVPDVDVLNNFDTIQRMSQPVHADTDLLVALQ